MTWRPRTRMGVLKARLVTMLAIVVVTAAWQQTAPTPIDSINEWLRDNALAIAVLLFHFGVTWREFLDHRRQLAKIPDTYVRKDVLEQQLGNIEGDIKEMKLNLARVSRGQR